MKATLLALFVALLMVGCGEDPEGISPRSNQATVETPDLDDPEILDEIFADALDMLKAEKRENKGQVLLYKPGEQTPYTGWVKGTEEEISLLFQSKDGQTDGCSIAWNKSGQKLIHMSIKEHKQDGVTRQWYANGQKRSQEDWKVGKFMACVAWKPNGERCQHTNLMDGDGVVLTYEEDGEEDWLVIFSTYKDGEWVSKSDPHPIKVKSAEEMTEDIDDLLEELEIRSSRPDYGLGPETLDRIIADAIDFDSLHLNAGLFLDPQKESMYTGWAKWVWSNGQVKYLVRFKDGKQDGPNIWWYKNGNKRSEDNWKANRQDGLSIIYNEDGTQRERTTWNHGKLMTAVAWRPDGEECPHTNIVKGNGVVVRYNYDGSEKTRFTYQDGELVSQTPINEKSLSEMLDNIEAEDLIEVLGNNSNPYDIDALLGKAEKLSSSREKEGGALPQQLPEVALDSQRKVTPPPAQSALPSSTTGSSEEIRKLAKNHYFGRESAPDYERAFALFTHLANAGDAEAARYLGVAYLRGKGVSKDSVKALQWFRVASQRGDALAAKNVRMLTTTPEFDEAMPEAKDKEAQQLVPIRAEDEAKAQTKQIGLDYHTIILNAVDQGDMGDNYTGWGKSMDNDGQIANLVQYKNGKRDGLSFYWHKNGQKLQEGNYKEGKRDGFQTYWFEDGLISSRSIFRDGKIMSGVSWKPNGEKCPVTKIDEDGNGVVVHYYVIEGEYPELYRETYKAGEPILELTPSAPNP